MIGLSAVPLKSAELLDARGVGGAGCTGSPGLGGFCRRLDPSHKTSLHSTMKIGITCYPTYGGSGIVATELGRRRIHVEDFRFLSRRQGHRGTEKKKLRASVSDLFLFTPDSCPLPSPMTMHRARLFY